MKIGLFIRMCIYVFVGYTLGNMGYGPSNWETWAILLSMAAIQLSELLERRLNNESI